MSCYNCKYWKEKARDYSMSSRERVGWCKFNAPIVVQALREETTPARQRAIWPITDEDDFCGQFIMKSE